MAGVEGFLGNLDQFYEEADAEVDETKPFLMHWRLTFKADPVTTGEIYERLLKPQLTASGFEAPCELALEGKDDAGRLRSLGWWLRQHKDQTFDLGPLPGGKGELEPTSVRIRRVPKSRKREWVLEKLRGGKGGDRS